MTASSRGPDEGAGHGDRERMPDELLVTARGDGVLHAPIRRVTSLGLSLSRHRRGGDGPRQSKAHRASGKHSRAACVPPLVRHRRSADISSGSLPATIPPAIRFKGGKAYAWIGRSGVKIESLMADETLPVISPKEASESVNSDSYNYLQLTNRSTAPRISLRMVRPDGTTMSCDG